MSIPASQPERNREEIRKLIFSIIAEQTGILDSRISEHSDLSRDLRIAGDDGDDLFKAVDEKFKIDWSELDFGVIFGNEGFGPVPPWHLYPSRLNGHRYGCDMYETEHRTVGDLVDAAITGKWRQRPPVLRPPDEQRSKFLISFAIYSVLLLIVTFGIVSAFK